MTTKLDKVREKNVEELEELMKQLDESPTFDTSRAAIALADCFFNVVKAADAEGDNLGELVIEWMWERYYGKTVEGHIPMFRYIHRWLTEHDIREKNAIDHGDADYSIWAEPHDKYKIVVSVCHCTCRDDNTYVYIYDDKTWFALNRIKFHCRSVWPRQQSRHGYLDKPSLHTYRRFNWNPAAKDFGYGDCRDTGYAFTFTDWPGNAKVDKAHWNPNEVYWALWNLRTLRSAIHEREQE